ncbi:hypothetical protein [Rheinheimera soli]|uniref:hypothetical protein n=1 Tax=Rheinheimera soli TaxID=443616 RepID=UPI001E4EB63A|nr:hypothetical protein [Rheinheimera soli]
MVKLGVFIAIALYTSALAASQVSTLIKKDEKGQWRVTYSTASPMQRMVFQRNPDGSRAKHWVAQSELFKILYLDGTEAVVRADGRPFSEVSFDLPAVYTPLPKEYAAFSPFSDGGMLLHSGRFFACAEHCQPELNTWTLTLKVPIGENIIVGGKLYQNEVTWQERDSGSKLYLGKATPLAGPDFISLIDSELPSILQQQISSQLPQLMAYFTSQMGALNFRPALFASYSATEDGSYGHQGGTLPGQIFMHWYGHKAIEKLQPDAVFWFFAHEVAHLYQREAGAVDRSQDAWVHEGAAEYLAGLATTAVQQNKQMLQQKLTDAGQHCAAGLEKQRNYAKAAAANSQLHYSCGLLLNHAIDQQLQQVDPQMSFFRLWALFNTLVQDGQTAQASTYLTVLKAYVSAEFWQQLHLFSSQDDFDALKFMQQLQAAHQPGQVKTKI